MRQAERKDGMRSEPSSSTLPKRRFPLRNFAWMVLLSLAFGALQIGYPLEVGLWGLRNYVRQQPASGQFVFVAIDDKSLSDEGAWPWSRRLQARLLSKVDDLGPARIFQDVMPIGPSTAQDDLAFSNALKKSGKIWLPARYSSDHQSGTKTLALPYKEFRRYAKTGWIWVEYDFLGAVWSIDRSALVNGERVPSFSAAMSGRLGDGPPYRVDYSIDPATIPTVSASDVLSGRVRADFFRNRVAIIGPAAERIGDSYLIPGHDRMPGALVHILGAETLLKGPPAAVGWLPAWLLASLVIAAALLRPRRIAWLIPAGFAGVIGGGFLLDRLAVAAEIVPALFLLTVCSAWFAWRKFRERGLTNIRTGLPNLEALRASPQDQARPMIAARVQNFAEVVSAMPREAEMEFITQIIKRLTVGHEERQIFQGDEGIFGWFTDSGAPVGNHLEALHSLFRQPVNAGGGSFDVAISFGVELGSGRALTNRFGSALVAADEAWAEGLRWKYHDPARQEEATWRLSLLSQLDAAIDNGEVWVAFQPQVRINGGDTLGAEALARWTHPDKGPISPSEFIAAAEQQDRIAKLTLFVLNRSVALAASVNQRGIHFGIAVNLSARMLADPDLPRMIEEVLRRHGLPPQRLTLELTETAALDENGRDLAVLDTLRALGVRLAIDDYGTGLSTLDYLKKIPATELKIDQSFIKAMRLSRSDRLMVQSTISLAHSLGRTVLAEGVEDQATLEMLSELGCDMAQGFVVGRPMAPRELIQRLVGERRRRAA
ncbi:EAL domain-containing protein [Sphingomonas ginkgonis]|uniref:EAL domain-containing protein n=1 Tax=Sphingomonas ginkgonis TaxID=2315330 RepID=A0A3R9WQ98_9SPHN|nr:EAL domain-containing protein [Sphingomonas ginkgonis]RST30788.1 EAL domain-containing protein [Sphingomonas ginkgonis]